MGADENKISPAKFTITRNVQANYSINFLSHNNPCFQCTCSIAITNFLVSHTCEIRFHDVIGQSTLYMYSYAKILKHGWPTWPNEYVSVGHIMAVGGAYVFPGFLTLVLTQIFFPKPPTTFLTCFCRGERRKYAGKKSRLNRGSNSQPPGHESDTSSPLSHPGKYVSDTYFSI